MTSLVKIHRYLGLSVVIFWVLQAISGVIISFNWEIDDALLSQGSAAFDSQVVGARIEELQANDGEVSSIWTSGSGQDRFDVYLSDATGSREMRIDGSGTVLRVQEDGEKIANGAWMETLVTFHQNLLMDETGSWIVGISGALLFSNIIAGFMIARPWKAGWRRSLIPIGRGPARARYYSWHRAIGLWAAIPALLLVGSGILLVFYDTVETTVSPPPRTLPPHMVEAPMRTGPAEAIDIAMNAFPSATLTALTMPTKGDKAYVVRLRQPGEGRKIYGMTTVIVDATTGSEMARFDPLNDSMARSFVDGLFPMHTGELGGLPGRIAAMLIGFWLLTLAWLGYRQWTMRRSKR
ncbi:PepSY-associated TM helix domain-containing protein [Croceicoccus sediminis]|uniref:PepSY-associated TM helix domain-containing protein n=1 Tax=Croceicoccus sediminis TaxID=2571150 RepID=UPI00118386A2|nr:PepSY-associated TM helix domain-containing protein [Croceicoccus sediminis]